jgi:hypothetical protein
MKDARVSYSFAIYLLLALPCWGQTIASGKAQTKGSCSPAITGSNNRVIVTCPGMTGSELLSILKKIRSDRINPRDVVTALGQIRSEVSGIRSLIPVTAGELFPANDPDPQSICKGTVPHEALKAWLGTLEFYTVGNSVVLVSIGGEAVLSLDRSPQGTLLINATVKSEDGRVIAQLESGKFYINPNNYYRAESEKSKLTVYDQQGKVALRVKYANPFSVLVQGYFVSGAKSLVVKEDRVEIDYPNIHDLELSGSCIGNAASGFVLK